MSEEFITALGPVAPNWERKTISDLAVYVGSGVTPTGGSDVYTTSGVTFIRSQNVTNNGLLLDDVAFIDKKTHERMNGSEVLPFDVLLNITGASIGRCCFLPSGLGPTNVNQHVCTIRLPAADEGDAKYLSSVLSSPIGQNQIFRLNAGGNREGLNYQQLRRFQIPWPPKFQRAKIARILTTLDNVITQTEALIAKYQAIKQGLMHDLFTRGVDATGKLRPPQSEAPELYKQSELGWIPKEWEVSCVESEFQISTGFTLGTHRRPAKNIRQYLRVANVQRDEIRMNDIAVLEATDEEFQRRTLQLDDLLVVEGHADPNQIGRCARVKAESVGMTFQNHLFRLQSLTIDSRFACEWLNSNVARNYWVCRCATSSGLNTINQTMLKRMPCLVPMRDEQERISARSDAQKAVIENTRRSLEKFTTLKIGLMQDLLTGRVPVKADKPEEITP